MAFGEIDRAEHIFDGISVGVVQLDVGEAFLVSPLELLGQITAPAVCPRNDFAFVVLLCSVGLVPIRPVISSVLFIEKIAIADADATPRRSGAI